MDVFGGPAALGGIIICVALGAWMLGRWQGGLVPAADQISVAATALLDRPQDRNGLSHTALAPVIPCQQAAQAERRGALEAASSLGDLHAEVSAYRLAQQVLAGIGGEQLDVMLVASDAGQECRYIGISGQPTCPMHSAVRHGSPCEEGCAAFRPVHPRAVQPSPAVSGFTRV